MILTCTCDELYCSTCDIPNGTCKECRKSLCPACQLEAVHQHRGVCPACVAPPRLDDADLGVEPDAEGPAFPYCKAGHLLDAKNTVRWKGMDCCVTCNNANRRAKYAREKAEREKNG